MYRAETSFNQPPRQAREIKTTTLLAPQIAASIYDRRTTSSLSERITVREDQALEPESQFANMKASDIWKPVFDLEAIRDLDLALDRERIIQFGMNQLLTEADEHAARSVISTHYGSIRNGVFSMNDFDMLKATSNALESQPQNTRIQAEYIALRKVMHNIRLDGNAQIVLSPAKEGMSYGLGFVFIPGKPTIEGGVPITQKIILYDQGGGGVAISRSIRHNAIRAYGIQNKNNTVPNSVEQHISSPISIDVTRMPSDSDLVVLFGNNPAQIAFAQQFKTLLSEYMGTQMQQYGELLIKYVQEDSAMNEDSIFIRQASHIKDTVFAVGVKLAHAMRTGEWSGLNAILKEIHGQKNSTRPLNANIEQLLMNAAVVTGGTQCPPSILERPTGMDILGRHHLDVMKNYGTEWNPVTECVKCPYCQFVSSPSTPHFKKGEKWSCGNASCEHNIHEKKTLM